MFHCKYSITEISINENVVEVHDFVFQIIHE